MTSEKFTINFRWGWKPSLTVEIECEANASRGFKMGLAVRAALESGADLSGADLRRAVLSDAVLRGADLSGADLRRAVLSGADLRGADLRDAVLRGADLSGADLRRAVLSGADLCGADLRDAVLRGADLRRADLRRAVLSGADLWNATGNSREVRTIQTDRWVVTYTAQDMQIGCQRHPITDWWAFDDERIARMDCDALDWWERWKPVLRQIVTELSPATPAASREGEAA